MTSHLSTRVVALLGALMLTAAACGGDDDGGSASGGNGDGSGSITFDGEELALENVICTQVAVEGDAWRVLADLDGEDGDITMNEGGGTTLMRDGVRWSNRTGDGTPQLDVGEHGVTGENGVYREGEASNYDDDVTLAADISC